MRSKTAIWFECKIKYEKVMEDGLQKQVVEQYVVDALSFAEAEQRITEQMSQYISGEFEVADVKKAAYKEVFFDDDNAASDRWYKAKLDFITIDERTEKEKRSRVTYLVQANVGETQLVDVFEYTAEDKAAELMARMAEDVKDASLKVEDIVDRYVKTATPALGEQSETLATNGTQELRQQLIDKLTEIRKEKFGIE